MRRAVPRADQAVTGRPVERESLSLRPAPEAALLTATALLAGCGLVMIHSATSPYAGDGPLGVSPHFLRHALGAAAAAGLAYTTSRIPLALWRRAALPLWALAVALLLATLVAGVRVNAAQRWLVVPGLGIRFQPAELAKLATVLAVAAVLGRGDGKLPDRLRALAVPALLAAIPAALLVAQPDFGNAVLLIALAGALAFVAGAPLRFFTLPSALGVLAFAGYVATRPYASSRLVGFLDPWARADREGFQLVQSFVGFARGGLFGVGIGDGRQKLFYLPEAHTDFILAVVAEELGLVGVLAVLGAFAALAVAGIQIARRARDRFALLAGFGATALLAVPALLNAAVVTGSVPPKGLPLPFVSYGRTSLLLSFATLGLLLAVARGAPPREPRFRR